MAATQNAQLAALGVTQAEETVYRVLVRRGEAAPAELATEAGVSRTQVRDTLEALQTKGLASRVPGRTPRFLANMPNAALEVLILQRREELERAREAIEEIQQEYRSAVQHKREGELVEIVSGRGALMRRFEQLQRSARVEVCNFDRPPYAAPDPEVMINPLELEMLRQGIRYRAIYDPAALDLPGRVEALQILAAAGEEIRVHPLPMKMTIVDRTVGLVPVRMGGLEIDGGVLVHSSWLLEALTALFEVHWERALPLRLERSATEESLASVEEGKPLLALLLAGLKDEAIGRQIGVSVRTIRRRVSDLMVELGASSRFQAGAIAARRGLV